MSTNRKDQLLAALIVTCLVAFLAEIMADETTTEVSSNTSWVSENNTQNAYVISSVQFEIGILENETEGSGGSITTSAPVETDKLTETKVAFLLPPAALFNSTQPTSAP